MHFVTSALKCFSKTNSTDPRQRVPSKLKQDHSPMRADQLLCDLVLLLFDAKLYCMGKYGVTAAALIEFVTHCE